MSKDTQAGGTLGQGISRDAVKSRNSSLFYEQSSRLLRVPVEIRFQILEDLLRYPSPGCKNEWAQLPEPTKVFRSLLLVNKQIYDEATVCFVRVNTFLFNISDHDEREYPEGTGVLGHTEPIDMADKDILLIRNVKIRARNINREGITDWTKMISKVGTFLNEVAPRMESLRKLTIHFSVPEMDFARQYWDLTEVGSRKILEENYIFDDIVKVYFRSGQYFSTLLDKLLDFQKWKMREQGITLRYNIIFGCSTPPPLDDFNVHPSIHSRFLIEPDVDLGKIVAVPNYYYFAFMILILTERYKHIHHSVKYYNSEFFLTDAGRDGKNIVIQKETSFHEVGYGIFPDLVITRIALFGHKERFEVPES